MNTRKSCLDLPSATISEADGVRYLSLGTQWVQGAMRVGKPLAIELEYAQRMMAWLLLRRGSDLDKGHAVQLGLGAGSITRFCHGKLRMRTTAVEINPTVIAACRASFHLPLDGPRLAVLEQDAAVFVAEAARAGSAQVLCVDLYDHEAAAPALDSEAFYADCRRLLGDDGVMSVNVFGRQSACAHSAGRIAAVFGESQVRMMEPTRAGNSIVVAMKSGPFPDQSLLAARARNIESRFHLPAREWLPLINALPPEPVSAV
ncbi:MAG: spermidine synthase [Proteobacteria bacterium]|nr:spermidine synthase [Pseudomonadota bacterium]